MKSRYVLTRKPCEPEDVAPAQAEGVLLGDDQDGPHKAKARHVMQGYSENGAEDLNSTTPQVAKDDTVIYTLQILCSMAWEIGNLDFTQAFHSGDPIERELYCEQPKEGIPGAQPRQLLRLKKTCYGLTDGPYAWYKHVTKVLKGLGYVQSLADPCLFYLYSPDHLCPAEDEGSKDRLCLKECPGLTAQGDDPGARRDKECPPRRDKLCGIIALATDDMLHGGGELHWSNMEILRSKYKMGKFATGGGRFVGKEIAKNPDGSFLLHQQFYILDKMEPIPMTKERKRQRYSKCEPSEVAELRTLLGGLSWVAKETRPDVAGRVALLYSNVCQLRRFTTLLKEIRSWKNFARTPWQASLSDPYRSNTFESEWLRMHPGATWRRTNIFWKRTQQITGKRPPFRGSGTMSPQGDWGSILVLLPTDQIYIVWSRSGQPTSMRMRRRTIGTWHRAYKRYQEANGQDTQCFQSWW